MLKKLFLLVLLLSIASICFAQADTSEQLTITTYYPSPYGVYKTLRLFPNADTGIAVGQGCINEGEMTYSQANRAPIYCDQNGLWTPLGGTGRQYFDVVGWTIGYVAGGTGVARYTITSDPITVPAGVTRMHVVFRAYSNGACGASIILDDENLLYIDSETPANLLDSVNQHAYGLTTLIGARNVTAGSTIRIIFKSYWCAGVCGNCWHDPRAVIAWE